MDEAKQILIVDDDPRNIFALNLVLKSRGYKCFSAPGAAEAFKILQNNNNIGIILMDMMMPDMDGYEAIAELRKTRNTSQIPVIALTAQAMVGDRERCLRAGAVDYVSKPVNVDALIEILQKYL
ncbi:response regulator [Pedobacter sp. HMF7647]|uniref:Response regulator n=1 Tax=Hufsiella arboris TaxID=2695275 RepID=A0A7K1YCI9_9SPHI|nr:response regulator [Hufsiella arboris]MXV51809.1 response regulator [Hufsiella arboris]